MAEQQVHVAPTIELTIGDSEEIGHLVSFFEWSSSINGGYTVRCKIQDAHHRNLKAIANGKDATIQYLEKGKIKPVQVKWTLKWTEELKTVERIGYLTDLWGTGRGNKSVLEFVAIDPPSFVLNVGVANGGYYDGTVSEVIKQIIDDANDNIAEGFRIQASVSETKDNPQNTWWPMRMDPYTNIMSLLDWSANAGSKNDQSRWVVSSVDKQIFFVLESELQRVAYGPADGSGKKKPAVYVVNPNDRTAVDATNWQLEMDSFISVYQSNIVTSGISAVSGLYIDPKNDEDAAVIDDDNTGGKINVGIGSDRAFTKPNKKWATWVNSVPEHSGGEVGLPYRNYAKGRAQQTYINILSNSMRMMVSVHGEYRLHDSSLLGQTVCSLQFVDLENEKYFLDGLWIIDGFTHTYSNSRSWRTDLELYRLDHNANAKIIARN